MRAMIAMLTSIILNASQALANSGVPENEGIGILAACFIGFGVMIILFQFIPGIMVMVGMLKGIFSMIRKDTHESKAS